MPPTTGPDHEGDLHQEIDETVRAARQRLQESREALKQLRRKTDQLAEQHDELIGEVPAQPAPEERESA
jgi:hypothetical protein